MKKAIRAFCILLAVFLTVSVFSSCKTQSGQPKAPPKTATEEEIYSIFLTASAAGYEGTYEDWLATVKGEKGADGVGIKEIKLASTVGNVSTFVIVLTDGNVTSFTITNGKDGEDGENGDDGKTPFIGTNGNWWIGETDTGVKAVGSDGEDGEDGKTPFIGTNGNWWIGETDTGVKAVGSDGASAYEIYKKNNPDYTGTEEEWIQSIAEQLSLICRHEWKEIGLASVLGMEAGNAVCICTKCAAMSVQPLTTYPITYVLDGGTNNDKNPDRYSAFDEINLEEPMKKRYTFLGWQEGNRIEKGSTGAKTFTALWEKTGPDIPTDLNYNGAEIGILTRSDEQYVREWYKETASDALDLAVYRRNAGIEDELGVQLGIYTGSNVNQSIQTAVMAGTGSFDLVSNSVASACDVELMAYYVNLLDSSRLPYLEPEKPWWNQNFRDAAEVFGKLFATVGDVNLSVYDNTIVTFFNQTLCEEYDILTSALYKDVLDGTWTFEKLNAYVKDVYLDKNSNGAKDAGDLLGLSAYPLRATRGFFHGFDLSLTSTDQDGRHSLSVSEKHSSGMDRIRDLFDSNGAIAPGSPTDSVNFFSSYNALFLIDEISASENVLMSTMTEPWGMIPVPKYDALQPAYQSAVWNSHNVISVINWGSSHDYEMLSAVLELLCYESRVTVRPVYLEKLNKIGKPDGTSELILDLMLSSPTWDYTEIYSGNLSNPLNQIWNSSFSDGAVSTHYSENKTAINTSLSELDQWFASLGK